LIIFKFIHVKNIYMKMSDRRDEIVVSQLLDQGSVPESMKEVIKYYYLHPYEKFELQTRHMKEMNTGATSPLIQREYTSLTEIPYSRSMMEDAFF